MFWKWFYALVNGDIRVNYDDNIALRKLKSRTGFQVGWFNIYIKGKTK